MLTSAHSSSVTGCKQENSLEPLDVYRGKIAYIVPGVHWRESVHRCREMPIHYQLSKAPEETKYGLPIKGLKGVSQCAVTKDPVSMCIIETINSLSDLSQSIMQAPNETP